MYKLPISVLIVTLVLSLGTLTGCDSQNPETAGRVQVLLTDAPLDNVIEANVTIVRVELIGGDEEAPVVLADEPQPFNLLTLQDGVTAPLADVEVPPGAYQQLRLVIADDAELVFDDASKMPLKVPSGTQTGIKILLPAFEIAEESDVASITVDFDASLSFLQAGAQYLFKPVIKPLSLVVNGEAQEVEVPDDTNDT